jgi:hypothetical protein
MNCAPFPIAKILQAGEGWSVVWPGGHATSKRQPVSGLSSVPVLPLSRTSSLPATLPSTDFSKQGNNHLQEEHPSEPCKHLIDLVVCHKQHNNFSVGQEV